MPPIVPEPVPARGQLGPRVPDMGGTLTNEVIASVIVDLAEHFGDLDDSDEAPFGELARVTCDPVSAVLTVMHQTEPWGVRITLSPAACTCPSPENATIPWSPYCPIHKDIGK